MTTQPQTPGTEPAAAKLKARGDIPFSSNFMRLSAGEWVVVALILLAAVVMLPRIWARIEARDRSPDARVPFALGNDYWTYQRMVAESYTPDRIAIMGDSVAWGHYVTQSNSLSAYLNAKAGTSRYMNAAVDGAHQLALEGLVLNYAKAVKQGKVLLQLNPLWLTDAKKDLSSTKESSINHVNLIPQFSPEIATYKEKQFSTRFEIVLKHNMVFPAWTEHLRTTYWGGSSLFSWSLENPYGSPLKAFTLKLPSGNPIPPATVPVAWTESGKYSAMDFDWVDLDQSLQWAAFKRVVALLKSRGNEVFVLVGPYNEYMIKESSRPKYHAIVDGFDKWLTDNKVPHWVATTLPSEWYADSSHPLAAGYAAIADQLLACEAFRQFAAGSK